MNLKTAIASLLVGTAAWSNGVEGFNVPSGAAVGSVRAVETNSAGSNSNSNSYSNLLAQIDDANPYAQNLKSKLSMVAGGAQAERGNRGGQTRAAAPPPWHPSCKWRGSKAGKSGKTKNDTRTC